MAGHDKTTERQRRKALFAEYKRENPGEVPSLTYSPAPDPFSIQREHWGKTLLWWFTDNFWGILIGLAVLGKVIRAAENW